MFPARELPLFAALIAGSLGVYLYRDFFVEPSRPMLALAVLGFVLARESGRPLHPASFGVLVAATLAAAQSWAARSAVVWVGTTVLGAALAIRAGGRGMTHLLPQASRDHTKGKALRRVIRTHLVVAIVLVLAVYLWDGTRPAALPIARGVVLLVAAILFMRYLLLQAKHLAIPVTRLSQTEGLVFRQRWPVLVVLCLVTGTPLPSRWLGPNDDGPLLLTSALLFVLAGLFFALALARAGWSRRDVRKASFAGGLALAFLLASVVAVLQGAVPDRFNVFAGLAIAFLLVFPLASSTTRLFEPAPRLRFVLPPPYFSLVVAPVAGASAAWHVSALRGFVLAVACLTVVYYVTVAVREQRGAEAVTYASASLAAVIASALVPVDGAWESFALASCYALYAVDVRERASGQCLAGEPDASP